MCVHDEGNQNTSPRIIFYLLTFSSWELSRILMKSGNPLSFQAVIPVLPYIATREDFPRRQKRKRSSKNENECCLGYKYWRWFSSLILKGTTCYNPGPLGPDEKLTIIFLKEIGTFVQNQNETTVKISLHKTTHFITQSPLWAVNKHNVHQSNT